MHLFVNIFEPFVYGQRTLALIFEHETFYERFVLLTIEISDVNDARVNSVASHMGDVVEESSQSNRQLVVQLSKSHIFQSIQLALARHAKYELEYLLVQIGSDQNEKIEARVEQIESIRFDRSPKRQVESVRQMNCAKLVAFNDIGACKNETKQIVQVGINECD